MELNILLFLKSILKNKNMQKLFYLLTATLLTFNLIAQPVPVGHLTIFSEDGDKFYLVLNGERQNNVPQTNLRVEELNQPYYNAKVIFEDKTLLDISKNYLQIADANGQFMDVTYKIRKDKAGKPKLNYFSMVPVQQGFIPPANVIVVHYGQPAPTAVAVAVPVSTGTTQVTQTTTTTVGSSAGVNVNVGGINMGVTITDPVINGTSTTTRTTTTTTHTDVPVHRTPGPPVVVGCRNNTCMAPTDFQGALESIKKQSFEDTKLSSAKNIAGKQCLTAAQISQVCKVFSFEESKLDFAKFAYGHCTDSNNYFKVNDVFNFSSSIDDLNAYTASQP
jgi:hypothetical protein